MPTLESNLMSCQFAVEPNSNVGIGDSFLVLTPMPIANMFSYDYCRKLTKSCAKMNQQE